MTLATSSGSQQGVRFSTGDRVRVVANYPGKMKIGGKTGTVGKVRPMLGSKVAVWVHWDEPGEYQNVWRMEQSFLMPELPQPTPPRFDTVEEADRWMAAQIEARSLPF